MKIDQLPDASDVLHLSRLIHELCEMGSDAYVWRAHLFSTLLPMLDCNSGVAFVMKHPIDPTDITPRMPLIIHVDGSESWQNYVSQGDLTDNPITPAMMSRMGTDFTVNRQELVDDDTWYASAFFKNVATPAGWDQNLNSMVAISPPGYVSGWGFTRAPCKPAFGKREINLVHFVHSELGRLWRRPDPIGVHTLPDRQREVLDGIRRGESRKQIAEKMGISDHTIHSYERSLFEKASVNSRGELLARLSATIRPNLLP